MNHAPEERTFMLEYVPDNLETLEICDKAVRDDSYTLKDVPYCLKTEKMCKKVVEKMPYYLGHVPNHFKTEEMCNKAVCIPLYNLKAITDDCFKNLMKQEKETWDGITCHRLCIMFFVPDRLRTQKMCNKAVCIDPCSLEFTADQFKTQKMCNKAVRRELYTLRYVSDHLGTQEMCDEAVLIIFPNEFNKTKGISSEAVSLITLRH